MDSFTSGMRDFYKAAESPKLPDLSPIDEFTYRPLKSPTSIRVLRVDMDAQTEETNPNLITLCIEEVDLTLDAEFNALSYVWGDDRPPLEQNYSTKRATRSFNILCDGHRMSVTYNLFCFLRRSKPLHSFRRVPLWIDQLCINQADKTEKAVQVAMMDRVYSRARSVISWLGEGRSNVDKAARLLQRLAGISQSVVARPEFDVAKFVADIPSAEWLALGEFLARPYFKRVWIVQEIAMAQHLVVLCGKHAINWDDLVHCSAILEESKAWTMLSRYVSVFGAVKDQIAGVQQPLHFGGQLTDLLSAQNAIRDRSIPPSTLLLLGRQFDVTVTADKFYALLGLYRRRRGTMPLTVDYTLPLQSIAFSFAKHHIETSNTLTLLTLVEDSTFRTQLSTSFPSWLPDPAAPLLPIPTSNSLSPLTTKPKITCTTLTLHGRLLTRISTTAPPWSTLTPSGSWHSLFSFLLNPTVPLPPSHLKNGQILWRVLTADSSSSVPKSPELMPNLDIPFRSWLISLPAAIANPDLPLKDRMMAEAMQQSSRLDDIEFDMLVFGQDAKEMVLPPGGNVVDDVIKGSELRDDYTERRERAARWEKRDDIKLAGLVEEGLRKLWEVDGEYHEDEDVWPSPGEVRRGQEVLDGFRFAEAGDGDVTEDMEGWRLRREVDRWDGAVGGRLEGRRLFWTQGGLLGIGGQAVEGGDEVWWVDGLGTVVVRGTRFMGVAFVWGLGEGEGELRELVLE
ncbi:heterokaryon incompatibility protein 6, OR allele [Rhypophila sp. PSN 637]